MLRSPSLAVLLVSMVVPSLACGGSGADVVDPTDVVAAVAQPAIDPLAYMPEDTHSVVRVEVDQALASPYVEILLSWVRDAEPFGQGREARIESLLRSVDVAYLAFTENDLGSVVFSGDFADGQIATELQALAPDGAPAFAPTQVGPYNALVSDDTVVVTLDARTYLMAPREQAAALVTRTSRPSRLTEASFVEVSSRIGMTSGTVRFAGLPSAAIRGELAREIPGMTQQLADAIVSYGASGEASNGIQGEVVVQMSDAGSAQEVVTVVNNLLSQVGGNIAVRAMGFGDVLAGISTRVEGTSAIASVNLDDQTVRTTLDRVRAFATLALQAAAERMQQRMGAGSPQPTQQQLPQ